MKRFQHINVKLELVLTVQLPPSEELVNNRAAFQEAALRHHIVNAFSNRVRAMAKPDSTGLDVVGVIIREPSS